MPNTKQIESRMFDLPEPLRPVIALNSLSKPSISVFFEYDLKPSMMIFFTRILSVVTLLTSRDHLSFFSSLYEFTDNCALGFRNAVRFFEGVRAQFCALSPARRTNALCS